VGEVSQQLGLRELQDRLWLLSSFLVPKLCLGTHFRFAGEIDARRRGLAWFREAELRGSAFPSRAWERGFGLPALKTSGVVLGGLKGGKARAAKLTKKQRSEIAKKAAQARWRKSP